MTSLRAPYFTLGRLSPSISARCSEVSTSANSRNICVSSGTFTILAKRVTGAYLPEASASISVLSSPNIEAHASKVCSPFSSSTLGCMKRCTEYISAIVLVTGVPDASTSERPGFFSSSQRVFMYRSKARSEPVELIPFTWRTVENSSLRYSCASST